MLLVKDNTIAIIVDVQDRLMPAMYEKERLEDNIEKLIKGLKILNVPIIYTQQYTKGLGMTVSRIRKESEEEIFSYIEKISFSCMGNEDFKRKMEVSKCKNVVVAGIETHICVMQTVRDLLHERYNVILVEDCIASRKPSDKEIGIRRMMQEGAFVGSYESILFELTQSAGHKQFKKISNLIK